MRFEIGVGLGKMPAPEKAVVGGERRGVRAFEDEVFFRVDERLLAAGVAAPKQKDEMLLLLAQNLNDAVREPAPAAVCVGICLMLAHGERRVHEEHALVRPLGEIARPGRVEAQVAFELLEDIFERRRFFNAFLHRKAQPVRLPRLVVGVLPQQHRLDLLKRREAEAVIEVVHIGVDDIVRILVLQKFADLLIALIREEGSERLLPIAEVDHGCASTPSRMRR
mgnify:CR=1 FL=1